MTCQARQLPWRRGQVNTINNQSSQLLGWCLLGAGHLGGHQQVSSTWPMGLASDGLLLGLGAWTQ